MELSLELLKKHVRADEFSDDDNYLQHLLDTAVAYIRRSTNRTEEELLEAGNGEAWPRDLQQAALLIAGHWYNQREAVSSAQMAEVPYTIQTLVKPFRKLV